MNELAFRGPMFKSFFMGGFECSSHRRRDGVRLDLLTSTGHAQLVGGDYRHLKQLGITTVRDCLRWHLIEKTPGAYDWSSFLPMLRAAEENGMQVIWDLCHYGFPDDLDIWSAAFVERFARFAASAAQVIHNETNTQNWYCAVNEISYWSWCGGDMGEMNPSVKGRGGELKRQLARASIAAMSEIRYVDPGARFVVAEPLINITTGSRQRRHIREAEQAHLYQFEAVDLLTGRREPGLGGSLDLIDVIGANFYPHNQWYPPRSTIPFGHHHFRPLSDMLRELHDRFGLPVFIAETGAEGSARASWLHYICAEVAVARGKRIPVEGVCLYPVTVYPGWDNDRHCEVGLFEQADESGLRAAYDPLVAELRFQTNLLANQLAVQP